MLRRSVHCTKCGHVRRLSYSRLTAVSRCRTLLLPVFGVPSLDSSYSWSSDFRLASSRRSEALMQRPSADEQATNERRKRKVARALAAFPGHWTMQHILAKRRWPSSGYVGGRLSTPDVRIGHFCDGSIDLYRATRVRSVEATDCRLQAIRTKEAQRIRIRRRVARETKRNQALRVPIAGTQGTAVIKRRVAAITGGLALGTLIFIAFLFALRSDLGPNITYHVYQAVQPTAEEPEVSLDLAPRMR